MNPVRLRAKDLWKPRLKTKQRILIAEENGIFARQLATYFWDLGFEAKVVLTIADAKDLVDFWRPDTIFVDLFIRESNTLSLVEFLFKRPRSDQGAPQEVSPRSAPINYSRHSHQRLA